MKLLPFLLAQAIGAAPTPTQPPAPPPLVEVKRALVQLRYQRSAVSVLPGLETIIGNQYPSPSVAADATRTVRDTAAAEDGLSVRRAWLELEAHPTKPLRAEIRVDFASLLREEQAEEHHGGVGPHHMVEHFFAEARPLDQLTLELGLIDIPFSLFELVDDPDLELAEKGPTHQFLEHLGFAGHDGGALVGIAPFRNRSAFELTTGFTGGFATGAQDYAGPGLFSARVLSQPVRALRLGAGAEWRPRAVDAWFEEYRFRYQALDRGAAYELDGMLSLGDFTLRLEWSTGDRTDNDVATPRLIRRSDARTFMAAWGMGAMRIPLGSVTLTPALRGEWLDIDREHDDAGGILCMSAAVSLDFWERWRVLWDLSQRYVQPGTRNWEFGIIRYDTDATIGVVQVQLTL
jgi:hypothetical protein